MSEPKPSEQANALEPLLEGRVAQILNARELIINIGAEQGVEEGMKFAVLSETPLEVRDPESGDVLDTLDREKVRVEAAEVRKKITICQTYRTKHVPGGSLHQSASIALLMGSAFAQPREVVETLKAEDSSLPPPLSPEESYVKINDRVIQVDDDEE